MLARHTGDSAKVAEARERCLQMSREHYRGHIVQAQTPSDKAIVDLRVDGKSSTDRVAVAHVAHGHAAINTSVACAYTGTGPSTSPSSPQSRGLCTAHTDCDVSVNKEGAVDPPS
jgi:hypothetical protein